MLNLKALLTKILTQITPVDASYGSGAIDVRRVGNIVYINSSMTIATTANNYIQWFTIASEFRPSKTRFITSFMGGNANVPILVRIEPSGVVSLFSTVATSGSTIWLSGSYII